MSRRPVSDRLTVRRRCFACGKWLSLPVVIRPGPTHDEPPPTAGRCPHCRVGSPIALYRINRALKVAEEESLKARQFAYASDMNLAQQAVKEDDLDRALQLLDGHRPTNDFGGASSDEP